MKVDVTLAIEALGDVPAMAREAEGLGFDGLWTAEAGHDPYLPRWPRDTRALIGTHRGRVSAEPARARADRLGPAGGAGGRFILGLGTQVKGHNERRFSVEVERPGPRLREMILVIRHIWDVWQTREAGSFQGELYTSR